MSLFTSAVASEIIFCTIKAFYATVGLIDFVTAMNWSKKTYNKIILTVFGIVWLIISIFSSDVGIGKSIYSFGGYFLLINGLYGIVTAFYKLLTIKMLEAERN